MVQYRRNQELLYETPEALPENGSPETERVQRLIATVRAAGRTLLTEAEAKELLAAYGIAAVPTVPCRTADEAVTVACQQGYPVVLKLWSETITHKTDVGGVQLNLGDEAAVRQAFDTIRANLQAHGRESAFAGVTVQPMIREQGFELIVGSSVDAQFGPVILFGAGGVMVEVFKDQALALPPLNRTLARRLIERTQIYQALKGVRGRRPVALDQLETLLVRFSQLLAEQLDIAELDINPLLATPDRVLALDARGAGSAGPASPLGDSPLPQSAYCFLSSPRWGRGGDSRDPARGRAVDHRDARHLLRAHHPHALLQHGETAVARKPDPALLPGL